MATCPPRLPQIELARATCMLPLAGLACLKRCFSGGWMKPLDVGQLAPDFELPGALRERKTRFRLSDYLDRSHVVLAFYPADFTPT